MQRVLTTVVLLGLLLATAAAFAITEHLKLIKSPIYDPKVTPRFFSPACHCATDKATIGFKLRAADSLTVTIVDSDGTVVDTLATDEPRPKGAVTFHWDGHTSTGAVAHDATYQPQVELGGTRTILMPNKITVDTTPPTVVSASDGDGILTTGGNHTIPITYDFNEKAHAAVYFAGQRLIFGGLTRPQAAVKWSGRVGGKTLPPGRYVVEVGGVDIAGNETLPSERKQVVVLIRVILLRESHIHVAPRASFTVDVRTGAAKYTWRFAGEMGTGKTKALQLRAPARPGRYRLVVSAGGHSTTGFVTVDNK